MTEIEYYIEHFFDAFEGLYNFAFDKCKNRIEGLILSCAYLDSLAGYKYGGKSNRDRFAKFTSNYSGQRQKYEKVSLPLLRYELLKAPRQFKSILQRLEAKFEISEHYYSVLNHDVDVNMKTLEKTMEPILSESEINKLLNKAKQFQYSYILWKDYRCKLIHETRIPRDVNIANFKDPFYINLTLTDKSSIEIGQKQTQFRFPAHFIFNTLSNCIKNFKEECINNSTDPFAKTI